MPRELILVRHGESDGNVIIGAQKNDDFSMMSRQFLETHSSAWRLTRQGCKQAELAGQWLAEQKLTTFDRYYVSNYARAQETAALLGLPGADWRNKFYLRERDRGNMDIMMPGDRERRFAEAMWNRSRDRFYWTPPDGESIADLCLRIDRVISTLAREAEKDRAVVVCHGEVMWAFRIILERLTPRRFIELDTSDDPKDQLHYGHIIHYSRTDPETTDQSGRINWMRSVCPWDPDRSTNDWQPIVRPHFSNEELLAEACVHERLISDPE
ncbi:MAG: phosphoglycerate mutase family protein [Candidatus Uhrbacteria bacterium]|nr:histidine phosphatase family protein [Patescibacteria group bacterium]MBU1907332.1 histidine phosphatase family protein [Patescibacteria group bacterium]